MQKNALLAEEPTEVRTLRGSKRKHRETACKDKRRDNNHCGLCGSANLVYHGVLSCLNCMAEGDFVSEHSARYAWIELEEMGITPPCACTGKRGSHWVSTLSCEEVVVCLDCGAVGAETCPCCKINPKNYRKLGKCWTSKTGEKYCQICGVRTSRHAK